MTAECSSAFELLESTSNDDGWLAVNAMMAQGCFLGDPAISRALLKTDPLSLRSGREGALPRQGHCRGTCLRWQGSDGKPNLQFREHIHYPSAFKIGHTSAKWSKKVLRNYEKSWTVSSCTGATLFEYYFKLWHRLMRLTCSVLWKWGSQRSDYRSSDALGLIMDPLLHLGRWWCQYWGMSLGNKCTCKHFCKDLNTISVDLR